jgi:hypothetical protein
MPVRSVRRAGRLGLAQRRRPAGEQTQRAVARGVGLSGVDDYRQACVGGLAAKRTHHFAGDLLNLGSLGG